MIGRLCRLTLFVATIAIMGSCGVSRNIPEGKYLVHKVVVHQDSTESRSDLIPSEELEKYVRQTPNRRLFGFNFYLWVYNMANPDKSNWWNNFKRSVGEEPVCLDYALTEQSVDNMKIYLDSYGFYSSEVEFSIDTMSKSRRVNVEYFTKQGNPFVVNKFEYEFRDSILAPLILADTSKRLVRSGSRFSVTLLDKERERIAASLRQKGYFGFSVRNITYEADTLIGNHSVDLKLIVNKNIDGYDNRGTPQYSNNAIYVISSVNIAPNYDPTIIINNDYRNYMVDTTRFKGLNIIHEKGGKINVRPNVLRQMTPFMPGDIFNSSDVDLSYRNLMSLGYFKSARINFRPVADGVAPTDSVVVEVVNRLKGSDGGGEEVGATCSPVKLLTANILSTPALRQSYNIELEGSTTSSFYGLYATIGYQNRNIFRGAESWSVDLMGGYEHMKAPMAEKKIATELALSTSLTFPRFMIPFANDLLPRVNRPQTKVELSVNLQDRPYYERTLSSASWSYMWRNRRYSSFLITPIDINIIDLQYIDSDYYDSLTNDYLRNSYETQLIAGISTGYTFNNQPRNLSGSATVVRFNAETAGNFIDGVVRLTDQEPQDDGSYEIFEIKYAQYARASMEVSHKIPLGSNFAVATRLYGGAGIAYGNSTSIPFDRLFYSGGNNSMRGWSPRTLGPGSSEIPEDDVYPSQVGDMKLEANIELRFPIWSMLHGATFLDAGNIWYLSNASGVNDEASIFRPETFYKELGFNTGVGLRVDIQFVIIRLDWGIQLHNPNKTAGERWVIKKFDLSNTALNFGVGYPF